MSTMSRRDLLRTAGVGLAGAAATGLVAAQDHAGHAEHAPPLRNRRRPRAARLAHAERSARSTAGRCPTG